LNLNRLHAKLNSKQLIHALLQWMQNAVKSCNWSHHALGVLPDGTNIASSVNLSWRFSLKFYSTFLKQ